MIKESKTEVSFEVTAFKNSKGKTSKKLTPKTVVIIGTGINGIPYFFDKNLLGNDVKIGDKFKEITILENKND